jgi:hypothetical protein
MQPATKIADATSKQPDVKKDGVISIQPTLNKAALIPIYICPFKDERTKWQARPGSMQLFEGLLDEVLKEKGFDPIKISRCDDAPPGAIALCACVLEACPSYQKGPDSQVERQLSTILIDFRVNIFYNHKYIWPHNYYRKNGVSAGSPAAVVRSAILELAKDLREYSMQQGEKKRIVRKPYVP